MFVLIISHELYYSFLFCLCTGPSVSLLFKPCGLGHCAILAYRVSDNEMWKVIWLIKVYKLNLVWRMVLESWGKNWNYGHLNQFSWNAYWAPSIWKDINHPHPQFQFVFAHFLLNFWPNFVYFVLLIVNLNTVRAPL